MTREIHYAERDDSVGVTSTISSPSAYKQFLNLNFQPKGNSTYFAIMSCDLAGGSSSDVQMYVESYGSLIFANVLNPYLTTNQTSCFFIQPIDYGASPALDNLGLWFHSPTGIVTTTARNGGICAIEKTANDFSVVTAEKSGKETTPQTMGSLTVTPAGSGNYLIIAGAICNGNSATDAQNIYLTDGTTIWGSAQMACANAENRPWGTMINVTLAGNTTYTIKVDCTTGVSGYYFTGGTIIALALDDFESDYYVESRARIQTNLGTYQDDATLGGSPSLNEHMLFACHILDSTSTGAVTTFAQIFETDIDTAATRTIVENNVTPTIGAGNSDYPCFVVRRLTLAGNSMQWKSQYKKSGGNLLVFAGIAESAIAVVQAKPTNGTVNILGANILGNTNIL